MQSVKQFYNPLREKISKRIPIHTGLYIMKHPPKETRKHLESLFSKRLHVHFTKNLRELITKRSIKRLAMRHTKHLWICLALTPFVACFHEPLDHDCPKGMERGTNYICREISGPLSANLGEDSTEDHTTWTGADAPEARCPENPALVKFHEVLIDPEGPDLGREWIELQVEREGVLDGLNIRVRNTLMDEPSMRIELRGEVSDDTLIMVADDQPSSIEFGCKTHGGCLRNTGGVIELYDCNDELLQSLAWGYAASNGVKSASGYSLSWCEQRQEWAQSRPTPNVKDIEWRDAESCPAPCEPPERLVFNEVLYDLVGPDGGGEFIELIGEPNTHISQVTLWAINGHDGKPFLRPIEIDGTTDAHGFYLIGGDEIDGRDQTLPGQLQNGPEALYLEACDDTWLDTMTYGGFTEHLTPYGDPAPVLPPGQSIGRYPDGATPTGTMEDFVGMHPTPRMKNEPIEP